jgi:hypothetical protein
VRFLCAAALLVLPAFELFAQGARGGGGGRGGGVPCRGQRIDSIRIVAEAPSVSGLRRVPVVGNVVRETHKVTRPDVIRRYLLFKVGDRCTRLLWSESERILRAQPFLADADIVAFSNNRGGVTLEVTTIDEASIILGGSISNSAPAVRSMRVGSANLAGLGIATSIAWGHHPVLTDRVDFRLTDYQFVGRPYVLGALSFRDALGRQQEGELTLPFRTDVQRFAWRARLGERRNHALFAERDSGRVALAFAREYAELGGIGRIGPPGRLTLLGFAITHERAWPDTVAKRLNDQGLFVDTAARVLGRFAEARSTRANLLAGVRGIRFIRARSLDALRGSQDVPMGLQFGTLAGRAIQSHTRDQDDLFIASDLYAGFGTPRFLYRFQAQAEGRHSLETSLWDGLVGSARLIGYARIGDRRTQSLSLEWSGTSRVRVPHALSLGIQDGGLRGYADSRDVGGRRTVARLAEQVYLGAPFSFGDFGFSVFSDAGKLWPGDVPYGVTTPIRAAAGVSLLLAVPRRSTRMWRLEFAAPFQREPGTSPWELRLSHSDRTSFFWREPADISEARARAVPASIYNWP